MTYPNNALDAVCMELLDEWELSDDQIKELASDLAAECEAIREQRNEAAWERQQAALMESGGPDNSAYRRDMTAAGRGHLIGEA